MRDLQVVVGIIFILDYIQVFLVKRRPEIKLNETFYRVDF